MSVITIKISEKIVETEATITSIVNSTCISQYAVEVLVPGANVFVEVISNNIYGYGHFSEIEISSSDTYVFGINAWRSTSSPFNIISSAVTMNIRSSAGGTILTTIVLSREHTETVCIVPD